MLTGGHLDVCSSVATRNHQISNLHRGSNMFVDALPNPSAMSAAEEILFSQLVSRDFGLSGPLPAINPNKVILTVEHKTREVLYT